ncbi:response regulator [Paenibacillus protaetiae]|uniref:Response regulator n=1 Tax=Paenibacillus protaetiae TaxID=2509456 RepID=A0A4P6F0A9_9BACL|nr:response regulator [Paenibacillus protaetiae]QAY68023.1 response regulator [Paenibacillus protaetiae]
MIDVLLVDDETYVTESLEATIPWAELGVSRVYRADSGKAALRILEEHEVDIVVTDIRMPAMTGLELIETIAERWPDIRCMLLTGYSDFEYAKRALQLHAADYILKPVDDGEFITSLLTIIEELKLEWEQADSYHRLLYNMKSDLGMLRGSLLEDLLLGRQLSPKLLAEKLAFYEIPFRLDEPAVLLLIHYGNPYGKSDRNSMELMNYAVLNIAEETLSPHMRVWHGAAPHNCLVIAAQLVRNRPDYGGEAQHRRQMLERAAAELREQALAYLKADLSLIVSGWFRFPDQVAEAYRKSVSAYYASAGETAGKVLFLEDRRLLPEAKLNFTESMYKPPTLIHLLESKQWEASGGKIRDIFLALRRTGYTREHLQEVFLYVTNAFMYCAHKQGQFIYELDHSGMDMLFDSSAVQSLDRLESWSETMLQRLRTELSASDKYAKSHLVNQVQEIVAATLGQDASVKTVADKVFLHPVYLSKVYKAETGESLSDYMIRLRMEKAHYLLKHSGKKIYEITAELGYQNPQYFSKLFRKYYGMTPHEFRGH